ncbi:MAG: DUF6757 family protein [Haloferacaceae archaeon]
MRCHYCDRGANFTVEKGGVKVGLCEEHFRERIEELAESEELAALKERLDIESTE